MAMANAADSAEGEGAARKVSDSFMADLAANRMADAITRYEDSVIQIMGRSGIEHNLIQPQFDACGRPLDARVENRGKAVIGSGVMPDGEKRVEFIFTYSSRTTRSRMAAKKRFRFVIYIAPDGAGKYSIAGFGCANGPQLFGIGKIA
jgi:hypothetical protein